LLHRRCPKGSVCLHGWWQMAWAGRRSFARFLLSLL